MKKLAIAVAMSAAFLSGAANAATVFSNIEETTEITQSGMLDKFDSALGTLISATLVLNGSATTTIDLTNNAAQAQTVQATANINLGWTDDLGGLLGLPALFGPFNIALATGAQSLTASPLAGSSISVGPLTETATDSFLYNTVPILTALTGNAGDTFTLNCESVSGLNLQGGGGNVVAAQSTTAGCGAEIQYTFDPAQQQVPSPAPLALMAAGLVGLAGLRRFKK